MKGKILISLLLLAMMISTVSAEGLEQSNGTGLERGSAAIPNAGFDWTMFAIAIIAIVIVGYLALLVITRLRGK